MLLDCQLSDSSDSSEHIDQADEPNRASQTVGIQALPELANLIKIADELVRNKAHFGFGLG